MNQYCVAVALLLLHGWQTDAFVQPTTSSYRVTDLAFYQRRRIRHLAASRQDPDDDLKSANFYDNVELSAEEMQPENMQDVLKTLINISTGPAVQSKSSRAILQEPSTDQLDQLMSKMESLVVQAKGPEALDDSDSDDAPYLDADAYTNYRSNINVDGSLTPQGGVPMDFSTNDMTRNNLKALVNPTPEIPDSYYTSNRDATLEDLFQTKQKRADEVDENLHDKIMAQEQGFQQQSAMFQDYLSGEAEGEDAAYMLRQQRRQQEEREMLLKLEQEMSELDEFLEQEPKKLDLIVCSKCGCPLTQVEIETGPKDQTCQVCYGDMIAETSDMRFLDAAPVEYSPRSYRSTSQGPPRRRETPAPVRAAISSPRRDEQTKLAPSEKSKPPRPSTTANNQETVVAIAQLKRQAAALHQQVQKYKQQAEVAERQVREAEKENLRLRTKVYELEENLAQAGVIEAEADSVDETVDGPWMAVTDPDTGEVFYWNEDTEEMKWEL